MKLKFFRGYQHGKEKQKKRPVGTHYARTRKLAEEYGDVVVEAKLNIESFLLMDSPKGRELAAKFMQRHRVEYWQEDEKRAATLEGMKHLFLHNMWGPDKPPEGDDLLTMLVFYPTVIVRTFFMLDRGYTGLLFKENAFKFS